MKSIVLSLAILLVCLTATYAAPQRAALDFDGDNRTDYGVARNSGGTWNWYLQRSTAGFLGQAWGVWTSDAIVPADYDGDFKWDIAVWRSGSPGTFYIFQSLTNTLRVVPFGVTGDDPHITQDFDGDHLADPAVMRNVGGTLVWYIQRSLLGFTAVTFGLQASDNWVRGDFDGDGKADVAVYRGSSGTPANTFFVLRSLDGGVQGQTFGIPALHDFRVPGDFDGDGKTDYAVYRWNTGVWYWLNSSDGSFHALAFGMGMSEFPSPGDYDGDGKTDQAVWRASLGTFFVNRSLTGFVAYSFGATGDGVLAFEIQVNDAF